MFYTPLKINFMFWVKLHFLSASAFDLDKAKILLSGKELTFSQMTHFKLFLKEFAEDNFKLYENGRKFSKMVENSVGKGEIARYEQFLLFPQCFQKHCGHKKTRACLRKDLRIFLSPVVYRWTIGMMTVQTDLGCYWRGWKCWKGRTHRLY